jgi:excisionase family DNA binding protein
MTAPKAVRHLTADELAERLGVPPLTVKYWLRTGYGPQSIKVGRHRRYRLTEVEAWEREQLSATG